jgi:hypothetical protein
VEAEPEWAAKYWAWKSAQASPASRAFSIVVDGPRRETRRATAAPTGGALAKGGTATPDAGTTLGDVASAADQSQVVVIYTLKLGNEVLGEWVNEPVIPGLNFGWAPAPLQFLAFTKRDGGPIVILDQAGRKHTLDGAKAAFLPAWSADGKEIAWLERKDRKKFVLSVTSVSIP